jgi:hypothetical protein
MNAQLTENSQKNTAKNTNVQNTAAQNAAAKNTMNVATCSRNVACTNHVATSDRNHVATSGKKAKDAKPRYKFDKEWGEAARHCYDKHLTEEDVIRYIRLYIESDYDGRDFKNSCFECAWILIKAEIDRRKVRNARARERRQQRRAEKLAALAAEQASTNATPGIESSTTIESGASTEVTPSIDSNASTESIAGVETNAKNCAAAKERVEAEIIEKVNPKVRLVAATTESSQHIQAKSLQATMPESVQILEPESVQAVRSEFQKTAEPESAQTMRSKFPKAVQTKSKRKAAAKALATQMKMDNRRRAVQNFNKTIRATLQKRSKQRR